MANFAVFPTLPGQSWSVLKTPRFATRIQKGISGRELRVLDQPNPIWEWTLTYEVMRDQNDTRAVGGLGVGYNELRSLMGFFCQCQGAFQPFLFFDPADNNVTSQGLAGGDGVTTKFPFLR